MPQPPAPQALVRELANQAFSRASGAPLRHRNSVRLLKDAPGNYPAWLDAIHAARRSIHFEMYIIHEDEQGRLFADALIKKAAEGVRGAPPLRLDGRIREDVARVLESPAGRRRGRALLQPAALRQPARLAQPRSSQDDRRSIARSPSSRACASARRGSAIPRGTSIPGATPASSCAVRRSPTVEDGVCRGLGRGWCSAAAAEPAPVAGGTRRTDVAVRVVATVPYTAGLFRVDQLVAALAASTLWLTDAYFAGTTPYVQALRRPRPKTASTSGCWCRARRTFRWSGCSRAPVTGRCSKPACACSSGTGRCCTPRPRSRTDAGRASDRPT